MSKIKQKVNITSTEDASIRREYDNAKEVWYYSVSDIIGVLTNSVDARNYWKSLKNRLNKTHPQLVSECNQLKLPSSDGKKYMVDVADAHTLTKIIRLTYPNSVTAFRAWFDHIDIQNAINLETDTFKNSSVEITIKSENLAVDELSPTLEIPVDIYENKNEIVIKFILAGCDPSELILSISMQQLTIKGNLRNPNTSTLNLKEIKKENYLLRELEWGHFERTVELPTLIDVDNVLATEKHGLITIVLSKIQIDKKRFIKIKSLV